jgi:hypothetical protein
LSKIRTSEEKTNEKKYNENKKKLAQMYISVSRKIRKNGGDTAKKLCKKSRRTKTALQRQEAN